jgi:CRP/FNR family transcriptional regulator
MHIQEVKTRHNMKKNKVQCDLKSCFFCTNSLSAWLPAIEQVRNTYKFNKGETLFEEGQPVTGIYFVNSGIVKVHKKWGDEKELILRFATNGEIVGHRGIGTESIFPVSGTAITEVTACFIEIDFFFSSLMVNTDLLYKLMMFFAAELQESEKKLRDLVNLSVKERVLKSLHFLEKKFGRTEEGFININISKQDLASFAGTTYETYFRMMNELAAEGTISASGKQIKLN